MLEAEFQNLDMDSETGMRFGVAQLRNSEGVVEVDFEILEQLDLKVHQSLLEWDSRTLV